jgi:hemoglobin-like flavoprotein
VTPLELVQQTLDALDQAEEALATEVYARFFARRPAAAALFGPLSNLGHPDGPPRAAPLGTSLAPSPSGCLSLEHRHMIRMTLVSVYEHLAGEVHAPSYVAGLGVEHDVLGVTLAMYEAYNAAMLEGLAAVLGNAWGEAHREVWHGELDALSARMRAGAAVWGT